MDTAAREELIRRNIEAWNSPDWEAELGRLWQPDAAVVAPEGWPEAGRFQGLEAVRQQFRRVKDSWSGERLTVEEISHAGPRSLARMTWRLRGEASGVDMDTTMWSLYSFREGRIADVAFFQDGDAAKAAAAE